MAGKKAGAAPLQVDVHNNDDWETFLKRPGLLVVDAYADWSGPCSGMAGNLRKIKVEVGGDRLTLATARSERIAALERFRGRCEPTWLFISNRQLLNVLLGADPPRLAREVVKQLRHLTKVASGDEELQAIGWNELTEDEKARVAAAEARQKRAEMLELARQEAERRKQKAQELEPFVELLIRHTVILFLPPVVKDGRATKAVEGLRSKWRKLKLRVRQQGKMQVSAETGAELFWERKLPQHDEIVKCLQSGVSLALLVERQARPKAATPSPAPTPAPVSVAPEEPPPPLEPAASPVSGAHDEQVPSPSPAGDAVETAGSDIAPPEAPPAPPVDEPEEEVESVVARLLYGFVPIMPPDEVELTNVPPSAADIYYGWLPAPETSPGKAPEEASTPTPSRAGHEGETDVSEEDVPFPLLQPAIDSAASSCLIRSEDESTPVLPGLWTPLTSLSKVSAVRLLYPVIAEALCSDTSEETAAVPAPLPPVVVLLFENDTAIAVETALASLPEDAADDVVKRAWTDASSSAQGDQRLALAILADATDTLAALRAVGPVYVSGDADTGAVDIGFYFPEGEAKAD